MKTNLSSFDAKEPREDGLLDNFQGVVSKPTEEENCDFIVVDEDGKRNKIYIEERPETEKPLSVGSEVGRGRFVLVGTDFDPSGAIKAILFRRRGEFKVCLIKKTRGRQIHIKVIGEAGTQVQEVFLESSFFVKFRGHNIKIFCLELDERVQGRTPRMIYFFRKVNEHPTFHKGLVGETIALENGGDINEGKIVEYNEEVRGFIVRVMDALTPEDEFIVLKDEFPEEEEVEQIDIEDLRSAIEENADKKADLREHGKIVGEREFKNKADEVEEIERVVAANEDGEEVIYNKRKARKEKHRHNRELYESSMSGLGGLARDYKGGITQSHVISGGAAMKHQLNRGNPKLVDSTIEVLGDHENSNIFDSRMTTMNRGNGYCLHTSIYDDPRPNEDLDISIVKPSKHLM